MATTAKALFESDGKVFVLCPHCNTVHGHDAATTPRLIAIPAACSEALNYAIAPTMKMKSLVAAMKLYDYESERKRAQYHRRKAGGAAASATDSS
jgi:hypothetical protein